MSEGLKDQINQAVKDRLSNPVWGYIILAWLGFNWESLAMLFMSDAPIKFRLDYINSNAYHLIYFFVAPIISGSLIAVITPYIQWCLSEAHKWADNKHREAINSRLEKKYEDQEAMAEKKFKGANAEKLAQAKSDADVIIEIERGKQAQIDTQLLEDKIKNLKVSSEQAEKLNEKISQETERLQKENEEWKKRFARMVEKLDELNKSKNVVSITEVKKALTDFYSAEDLQYTSLMIGAFEEAEIIKNNLLPEDS